MNECPDCKYYQEERAAIHQYDGKASRFDAERWARDERCPAHRPPEPEAELFKTDDAKA